MALSKNDPFVGSDTAAGRVQGTVFFTDVKTMVADQQALRERLTNKNADAGGGAPTYAGHSHNTDRLLMFWPIMTQMFGDENLNRTNAAAFPGYDYGNDLPAFIYSGADIAPGITLSQELFQYFPIWIPDGFAGKTYILATTCFGDTPGIEVSIETWAGTTATAVAGMTFVPFHQGGWGGHDTQQITDSPQASRIWFAEFTPAVAGLHAVKVTAAVRSQNLQSRYFTDIAIFPKIDPNSTAQCNAGNKPDTTGLATVVDVGDPDGPNTLHPIDDVFVAEDGPLGAAVLLLGHNDAMLQELALDLPCGGNQTRTITNGHDHSETGDLGKGVEFSVGAWTFGPWPNLSGYFGGNGGTPPQPKTSTFQIVSEHRIYMPKHSLAQTPATPRLKGAVMCYNDNSKVNEQFECKITVGHPTNGAQQETITFTATNAGVSRHELLQHPAGNGFRWVSGGETLVRVQVRNVGNSGNANCALLGFCLYFDQ